MMFLRIAIVVAILSVVILSGVLLSRSEEPQQGAGLGNNGDYATFDSEGNFTGIEMRK